MNSLKLYQNKKWLQRKYLREKLNTYRIAELCECHPTTIGFWLQRFGVLIRSRSEAIHLTNRNNCILSDQAKEWINGELLGDGSLFTRHSYSAVFKYSSKHFEYIKYISDILMTFGIKQAGKINKEYFKKLNCFGYHYRSLEYEEFLSVYHQWYPNGKKIIPRNIYLSPLVCRQWYIGDGFLGHPKGRRNYIQLCTNGFAIEDVEWLVSQLNILGFKTTREPSHNMIYISVYSTEDFLYYIGDCPVECYQYKWNYN